MVTSLLRRRITYSLILAVLVAAAVGAALFLSRGTTARASQETFVELVQPQRARVGEQVDVKLIVNNAHNLAGFQSGVSYDPAGLRVAYANLEDGLRGSGRDVMLLGPAGGDGKVILGAATCPAADCTAARPWNEQRIEQGVDGRVELATITFYADAPGRYELKLEGVQLVDPQGNLLTTGTANTVIEVTN